jgi:hypothetical protein
MDVIRPTCCQMFTNPHSPVWARSTLFSAGEFLHSLFTARPCLWLHPYSRMKCILTEAWPELRKIPLHQKLAAKVTGYIVVTSDAEMEKIGPSPLGCEGKSKPCFVVSSTVVPPQPSDFASSGLIRPRNATRPKIHDRL